MLLEFADSWATRDLEVIPEQLAHLESLDQPGIQVQPAVLEPAVLADSLDLLVLTETLASREYQVNQGLSEILDHPDFPEQLEFLAVLERPAVLVHQAA